MSLERKYKVLIVEDELLIGYSLQSMLEPNFEIVDIVINFQGAIETLKNEEVDIVLVDVTLEGDKTGMDLAAELNRFNIPFIFLTALIHEEGLEKLLSYKPAGYLSKPISKPDLIITMNLAMTYHTEKTFNQLEFYSGKIRYNFDLDKLLYVQAEHIYCQVYLTDQEALLRCSLNKIVEKSNNRLRRINRKIAINPQKIRSETRSEITLENDTTFTLSKHY